MDPNRYNFKIWKGGTFRQELTLYNDDDTPWDLTDYEGLLEIRSEPEDDVLLTLSDANDGITFGDEDGTITLYISADDTAEIDWESGVYDLTITGPSGGDTEVLLFGNFKVRGI